MVINTATSIDRTLLIASGATQLRTIFTPEQLPIVLNAYLVGIKAAFTIAIGMLGFACFASLLSSWKNFHEQRPEGSSGSSEREMVIAIA